MKHMSRRDFLKAAGVTSLGSLIGGSYALQTLASTIDPSGSFDYTGWENFHREQWSWEKKTRGAHLVNCTGACPHFVYTKNGVVLREEQSKDIPLLAGVPEGNPRGCNKGECGTDYMYGPQRIKYPLIRVGERGEGKWRRATWDEALDIIADKIIDTIKNQAPDCISVYSPVPAVAPVAWCAGHRFAHLIGAHVHSFFDWYSDHPTGQTQTYGVQADSCETSDWYNAKLILLWGSNPAQTRIPDAHYISEASLNGTKVVSISPDYNSSSIKADQWIHPKPGTDGALAMAMAHVIFKDKLYAENSIKEQTDLPYLVRTDNRMFLREADVVDGGSKTKFYVWDTKTNRAVIAKGSWGDEPEQKGPPIGFLGRNTYTFPKDYIALGELDPALEGTFRVKLANNKEVEVTTVFTRLNKKLMSDYSPDTVSRTIGVPASVIIKLAHDLAAAKPAMIITGGGINHWHHCDATMRTLLLLMALTDNVGKNGGGMHIYVGQWKPAFVPGVVALAFPRGGGQTTVCPDNDLDIHSCRRER
ncbi:molybdopterin-dependent oxidoreductase [Denitromonas sp.]|uniref:molybdopterin-dependent oxidoreductase n=1 Tax=Denitromonas sp. TaxID=2734609 RepID=UPI002B00148D|nr:molybdopterin-dependent oxidoreductase [Denitromonas sp.]